MIASWTAIAWAVRLCCLYPNMRCFMIAKKEGDSDGEGVRELVWRSKWIVENMRGGVKPVIIGGKLHVEFPETGSTITGVSSDPNVMRQVAANFVLGDEFAFWDKPRDSYASLKPTLEARGKFVGLSSSAEGFFKQIVRDEIEEGGGPSRGGILSIPGRGVILRPQGTIHVEENAPALIKSAAPIQTDAIPGFAAWTNPINKFRIIAMHYTADPRKRSPEWKAREQEGVPLSIWLREYEMQFDVASGRPVYLHEWRPQTMLVPGLKTERTRPIIVGLDFGYHHPAMVAAQMRYGQQFCVLRTLQGKQVRFEDFMAEVLSSLKEWFPNRHISDPSDFIWCCDASGEQEHATGAPEIKILRRVYGLRPKYKKVKIPPTIDIVRGFMSRTYRGEPCFLIDDNSTNTLVIDGLNGGYAYPPNEVNELTVPVKDNIHDHVQDILRYIAVNFGGAPQREQNRAAFSAISKVDIIERPTYAF